MLEHAVEELHALDRDGHLAAELLDREIHLEHALGVAAIAGVRQEAAAQLLHVLGDALERLTERLHGLVRLAQRQVDLRGGGRDRAGRIAVEVRQRGGHLGGSRSVFARVHDETFQGFSAGLC
jgi:hypothetical protein